MKVMYDTSVYISYIRSGSHSGELERRGTVKYISCIVLMELYAGAKTRDAERFLEKNLRVYASTGRTVALPPERFIAIGQFISDLPRQYATLIRKAAFINDILIAFTALSIGATLYTEDRAHFEVIGNRMPSMRIEFLQAV